MTGHSPNTFVAQIGLYRIMLSGFDPPQWLVQRHFKRASGKEWDTILYYRNRDAMIRLLRELRAGDDLSAIEALPEWCPDPRMPIAAQKRAAGGDEGPGGSYPT